MLIEKTPEWIRRFFPSYIWKIEVKEPVLFLTFDDGPIPEVTPKVIQLLEKYNAKATFFCVGDNVRKHPAVFQEIKANNHDAANHTFNHLQGLKTNTKTYIDNVEKAALYIESNLFRPPHGLMKQKQVRIITEKLRYKIIMWDVLSRDYEPKITTEKCWQNVKHNATNGSIIVFHDSIKAQKNMLYALSKTLDFYSERGFRFQKISKFVSKKFLQRINT